RAIASRKRGLTPSPHAAMQSPVSAQPLAQARDAIGPSPVRTISSTPEITLSGVASPTPAGFAIGQTSTHLPQRVEGASISAVRGARAASKSGYVIVAGPVASMIAPRDSIAQYSKEKAATRRPFQPIP